MINIKSEIMKIQNSNYCVILAGGKGRRLWPSSRMEKPKQFLDFFGVGSTLLQQTVNRFKRFIPLDHIYISTVREYVQLIHEQLPEIDEEHLLIEPVSRNTAPAVAWAGRRIHRNGDDCRIVVSPADQLIIDEEAFERNVLEGLEFVGHNDIMLTMGIRPSRPEPGYGYIQVGEPTLAKGINKVQSFTEKPERDFARVFMESGEFFWNTGLYLANVCYLRDWYHQVIPDLPNRLSCIKWDYTLEEELDFVKKYYPSYPNLSMDQAALEMTEDVYVMQGEFGWADIGTWHSIYECMQKTADDNVVLDSEVLLENARNNIICLPKGHIGVINGLDGFIVAEQGDVLLICPKGDSSALIRKYVNEVGIRYGEQFA